MKPESKLDNLELTTEEQKRLILLDTNYTYSRELAQEDAKQIAAELNTQDGGKRTIGKTFSFGIPDTIRFPHTKRTSDPGFYVFNFSNDGGFAIISGDKRAPNRLGWTDAGNLDSDKPHAVFGLVLPRLAYLVQAKRKEVENMWGDQYHISLLNKITDYKGKTGTGANKGRVVPCQLARTTGVPCNAGCTLSPSTITLSSSDQKNVLVNSLLTTKWGQGPPFNNYMNGNSVGGACDDRSFTCATSVNNLQYKNNNVVAGCVPVSEAMVIACFWGKRGVFPTTGSLNPSDWATIANTTYICDVNPQQVSSVAALIRRVFVNYNVTWSGCNEDGGTGVDNTSFFASEHGISPTFNLQQKQFRDFYSTDFTSSIQGDRSPVLVQAFSCVIEIACIPFTSVCWTIGSPNTGHQWVMDGVMDVNRVTNYSITPVDYDNCIYKPTQLQTTTTFVNRYHHSNWGWGGSHNGWFLTDTFGGIGIQDNLVNSIGTTNYKYKTQMLGSSWPQ